MTPYRQESIFVDHVFSLISILRAQFNFYDHSKVVLSAQGLVVTHIDKDHAMFCGKLSQIMAQSLLPTMTEPEQAKLNQRLVDKLKYCKEVLVSIKNASAAQAGGGEPQAAGKAAQVEDRFGSIKMRSKASLR